MERFDLNDARFVGHSLNRPECAVAHSSGFVFVPDWTGDGGVSVIFPDGGVKRHLAVNWSEQGANLLLDEPLRPNGICLLESGSFLLAHLGAERGGIFKLDPNGTVQPFITEIGGIPLPPTNFVTQDEEGRTWITVSTRRIPRSDAYRSDVRDGFVAVVEGERARIVADGLGYTNECMLHPDGRRLFVNETFARRLTAFDVAADGGLTNRQTIAEFGPGTFPDGLAFDEAGDAWITSIVSNRVLRVDHKGRIETLLEDVDEAHVDWVEEAWRTKNMGRPHLDKAASILLRNISNLAFFEETLNSAVLGCLLGDKLVKIDMPVRGFAPQHWTYDIGPLTSALGSREFVQGLK